MSVEPTWIPLQAIIGLHKQQIAEHGGLSGIQQEGSLESALARAKQVYSYSGQESDISSLAAAHAWGIARNHPFVDGNKRMALIAIYVFLGLNGYYLDAREQDAFEIMMDLANGALDEGQLSEWIAENSLKLK